MTAALVLTLAGCGAGGGAGTPDELRDRTFVSTSVTEQGTARPLAAGTRVELIFHPDGRLTARAGCNSMGGSPRFDGDRLVTGELSGTLMGCDAERHRQDEWLATFLGGSPQWRLTDGDLVLEHDGTVLRLTPAAVAATALRGTRWDVDSLIAGGSASSVPAGTAAFLTIGADGRVTGSTGCNSLTGVASLDPPGAAAANGTLSIGELTVTEIACQGDAGRLERAVLTVLRDTMRFRLEGRFLTLSATGDTGLRLAAG